MGGVTVSYFDDATGLPQVVDSTHPLPVDATITGDGVIAYIDTGTGLPQQVDDDTHPLPVTLRPVSATPLGYEQIVGLAASTALTVPGGATSAVIVTESQTVRWRDDGVAPTAAIGMPLLVQQSMTYDGDLSAIRFIEAAATATLNIAYYS